MRGVVKVYQVLDGKKTLLFQEDNTLTFGFKNQIISLMTDDIILNVGDYYKISYFQLGGSTVGDGTASTSSNIYTLSAPFDIASYGDSTSFPTVSLHNLQFSSGNLGEVPESGFDGINISAGESLFVPINNRNRTKIYTASLDYRIKLTKTDCVGRTIREAALFIKNPYNYTNDVPMMAAYKRFPSGIIKSANNELIIDWSIMLYDIKVIDTSYTDAYAGHVKSLGFDGIEVTPIEDPCTAATFWGWPCLGQYSIPGLIPGALTVPMGGYLGPAGGGTPPAYLIPGQTYCFWTPPFANATTPVSGEIRFQWKYLGYGYWIYLGYNNIPYQGPGGGGSF